MGSCSKESQMLWSTGLQRLEECYYVSDGSVPYSCCQGGEIENCGKTAVQEDKVYTKGCFTLFSDEFNGNLNIVGGVALIVALGELIAIAFACCLGGRIGRGGQYV